MEWLKKLWDNYMAGAKANNFPIWLCGLFGDKLKKPRNLEQALFALGKTIDHETRRIIQELNDEDHISARLHHTLGRYIRNEWGLWAGGKLHDWFKSRGIWHADDMSGIIITSYWRQQHGVPIQFQEQVRLYQEYWAKQDKEKDND